MSTSKMWVTIAAQPFLGNTILQGDVVLERTIFHLDYQTGIAVSIYPVLVFVLK